MKILSIGNSFSQDAHRWLHSFAAAQGIDMQTANLFIGGCSLKMHYDNLINDTEKYAFELNGNECERMISLEEAIKYDDWDIITIQQVSNDSGKPQSYFPYLNLVCDYVKETVPNAELYIQETWSYEIDVCHSGYFHYHHSQEEMYRRLHDCYEMAANLTGGKIIPAGTVVQALREETKEFNYRKGGRSLCRDGFHMSYDYGRYAVAATWVAAITGADIRDNTFIPEEDRFEAVDPALLKVIRDKIYEMEIHKLYK